MFLDHDIKSGIFLLKCLNRKIQTGYDLYLLSINNTNTVVMTPFFLLCLQCWLDLHLISIYFIFLMFNLF